MPLSNQPTESWREALKFINRCPLCGANYNTEEARLFASYERASLVHLTCSDCHSFFVAMIVMMGHGVSSVGMVTDLSFVDVKRLHQAPPITTDEMIEGYQLLESAYFGGRRAPAGEYISKRATPAQNVRKA